MCLAASTLLQPTRLQWRSTCTYGDHPRGHDIVQQSCGMDWVAWAPTQQAALTCERHGVNYALQPARTRLLSLSCALQQVASQSGVPALARTLNAILVDHIRALLPSLRVHLEESAERRAKELAVLGDAPPGNTSAARSGPAPEVPAH